MLLAKNYCDHPIKTDTCVTYRRHEESINILAGKHEGKRTFWKTEEHFRINIEMRLGGGCRLESLGLDKEKSLEPINMVIGLKAP